jgi:hypothetical protein
VAHFPTSLVHADRRKEASGTQDEVMKSALRSISAFIGLSALALQFWLEVGLPHGPSVIGSTFNFVSYLTILANTFAALAMLLPLVAPGAALGRFLSRPSVRTAIAGYMVIVGATYFLFLRHLGTDQGLERRADELLHYATPILFLIDWLAFVPKGYVPWTMIGTSLITPIVYGFWTMGHGALTNWYPYPFIDVGKIGYHRALMNMVACLGVFGAVALALVLIDRVIGFLLRRGR